jgi:hypothetical protein
MNLPLVPTMKLPADIDARLAASAAAQGKTVDQVIIEELREVERLRREVPDLKSLADRMQKVATQFEAALREFNA